MNHVDKIMALADTYAEAAVQWSRKVESDPTSRVAIVGTDAHRQALRTAIEQALTPGEPVASIYISPNGEREFDDWRVELPVGRNLLYTAPQPQPKQEPVEWVDLTPKEVRELFEDGLGFEPTWTIYQEISAKLREKNGGTK